MPTYLARNVFFTFGVLKTSTRGVEQPRLLNFDFEQKVFRSIDKEVASKNFDYADITKVTEHSHSYFTIEMTQGRKYRFCAQGPKDAETIGRLLKHCTGEVPYDDKEYNRAAIASGHVLKRNFKTGMFQKRFLVLVAGRMLVFNSNTDEKSSSRYPRNVTALESATKVALLSDGVSFNIKYGNERAESRIGFIAGSPAERDQWIELLRKAMRTPILVSQLQADKPVESVDIESLVGSDAGAEAAAAAAEPSPAAAATSSSSDAAAGAAAAAAAAPPKQEQVLIDWGADSEPATPAAGTAPAAAGGANLNELDFSNWGAFGATPAAGGGAAAPAAAPAAGGSNNPFASFGDDPFGGPAVAAQPVQPVQPVQPFGMYPGGGFQPSPYQQPMGMGMQPMGMQPMGMQQQPAGFPAVPAAGGAAKPMPPIPPAKNAQQQQQQQQKTADPFAELPNILENTHLSKAAPSHNPFDDISFGSTDPAHTHAAAPAAAPAVAVAPAAAGGASGSAAPAPAPGRKSTVTGGIDMLMPMRVNPSERKSVHDAVTAKYERPVINTVEINSNASGIDSIEKSRQTKAAVEEFKKMDNSAVFFDL